MTQSPVLVLRRCGEAWTIILSALTVEYFFPLPYCGISVSLATRVGFFFFLQAGKPSQEQIQGSRCWPWLCTLLGLLQLWFYRMLLGPCHELSSARHRRVPPIVLPEGLRLQTVLKLSAFHFSEGELSVQKGWGNHTLVFSQNVVL